MRFEKTSCYEIMTHIEYYSGVEKLLPNWFNLEPGQEINVT